jgi:hypothetical protein
MSAMRKAAKDAGLEGLVWAICEAAPTASITRENPSGSDCDGPLLLAGRGTKPGARKARLPAAAEKGPWVCVSKGESEGESSCCCNLCADGGPCLWGGGCLGREAHSAAYPHPPITTVGERILDPTKALLLTGIGLQQVAEAAAGAVPPTAAARTRRHPKFCLLACLTKIGKLLLKLIFYWRVFHSWTVSN